MEIITLNSVDSTNEYLKTLAKAGAQSGTVVISKNQTYGKGSHGRSFDSPNGGLYLSYLYNVKKIEDDILSITQWAAVAVYCAIKSSCGVECQIKYINDLLYDGKKLCGILTELTGNSLIVGIGINVNTRIASLSESFRNKAISLCEITGKDLDIDDISTAVIHELESMFDDYPSNPWRHDFYDSHCIRAENT